MIGLAINAISFFVLATLAALILYAVTLTVRLFLDHWHDEDIREIEESERAARRRDASLAKPTYSGRGF